MIVCETLDKCAFPPEDEVVVALGVFDGIHGAHRQIINECKARARKRGGKALIFTFQNHPMSILAPEKAPPLLTPYPLKKRLMQTMNIDVLMALPFNIAFSQITAREFIEDILIKRLNAKEIVVGFNFHFGHKRKGHPAMLKDYVPASFDDVMVVERQTEEDALISSTLIREYVANGELEAVKRVLERPYQLAGEVITGDGRGRQIGFPTANINTGNQALPPSGVYAVRVRCDSLDAEPAWGVMNIGRVPTFKENAGKQVEIHLPDDDIDLYGHYLIADLHCNIRNEIKFNSAEELISQIQKDIETMRNIITTP